MDIGVGLVRGGEGLDAGLAELAGVLAVLGREVTRTLVDDIEVELGEEVGDPLCVVVVWLNNILLREKGRHLSPPLSVYGAYFLINGLASQNFLCPTAALEEGVDEQETQRNPIDNHRYTVISASGDGT